MSLNRKQFIRKAAAAAAGFTFLPKFLLAESPPDDPPATAFIKNENAIIDLHCHPSMKMWLWGKKFWNAHWSVGKGDNLFPMQENHHQFMFGNVRGIMATHYLLEAATEREWNSLRVLYPILKWIPFLGLNKKIEIETVHNSDQVLAMIALLNKQLDTVNGMQSDVQYVIVDSYEKFVAAMDDPKQIAVAHAIEGGHALGRYLPNSRKRQGDMLKSNPKLYEQNKARLRLGNADPHIENLHALKAKGVCMITLSHFFRNDLTSPVDGISPDAKGTPDMAWEFTPDQDRGLSEIGRKVVTTMLKEGIIVDLTHTAPKARGEVIALNRDLNVIRAGEGKAKRPLVFTHTGAQQVYDYYDLGHYPFYKYYAVSDEEIAAIEECGGVIGVIAENFWLVGADTHMKKEFRPGQFKFGIPYMIQTMKYINSKTVNKQFDHIGIGTDFDGLADNPKDLYKNKQMADLILAMQRDPELNQKDYIAKITYLNSKRLLQYGWGERQP
jgi:microsomal dipeptidase-like Zn-dependent dipeptidase